MYIACHSSGTSTLYIYEMRSKWSETCRNAIKLFVSGAIYIAYSLASFPHILPPEWMHVYYRPSQHHTGSTRTARNRKSISVTVYSYSYWYCLISMMHIVCLPVCAILWWTRQWWVPQGFMTEINYIGPQMSETVGCLILKVEHFSLIS